jgi:hypothetical protein
VNDSIFVLSRAYPTSTEPEGAAREKVKGLTTELFNPKSAIH